MKAEADLGGLPSDRLRGLEEALGRAEVVKWCADLLVGRVAFDDPEQPSLTWLGGEHAAEELRKGRLVERGQDYWPRVWAARGLLHVWDPSLAPVAVPALVVCFADRAWRVREMAAKVARHWQLGEAADDLARLVMDPVPRVRAAAAGALGVVGEAEHAEVLRTALDDDLAAVRQAAGRALRELGRRLDRSFAGD